MVNRDGKTAKQVALDKGHAQCVQAIEVRRPPPAHTVRSGGDVLPWNTHVLVGGSLTHCTLLLLLWWW